MIRGRFARRALRLICFACVPALCGCAGVGRKAEIAGLLLDMKRDTREKAAVMERETRNFRQAKDAIRGFTDKTGPLDMAAAHKLFGEPVSVFKKNGATVWGYKPASSDWFNGEKIFVTFDEKGMLLTAEYVK